jgi:hypothetical protein
MAEIRRDMELALMDGSLIFDRTESRKIKRGSDCETRGRSKKEGRRGLRRSTD